MGWGVIEPEPRKPTGPGCPAGPKPQPVKEPEPKKA